MYCPFCGKKFKSLPRFCDECGKSLIFLKEVEHEGNTSGPASAVAGAPKMPSLKTSLKYNRMKSEERQNFSCHKKGVKKKEQKKVKTNIGVMCLQNDILRSVRGKTLPLIVERDIEAAGLHRLAVERMTDFSSDLAANGPYVLIYSDTTEVNNIPGTSKPFTLEAYKNKIGKPYNRITFYICPRTDYDEYLQQDTSDTDREVNVKTRSVEFEGADTMPCESHNESTPKNTAGEISYSSAASHPGELHVIYISDSDEALEDTRGGRMNTTSSTYTQRYAPIVIDDDEDKA